jgi:O-antigen/teichoic acid export membrane protein
MIKSVLQSFLSYGLGQILQTALRFILLPLYLRFFTPEEYGVISVLTVVLSLLTLLTTGGIINVLMRLYYEAESTKRQVLVGATWLWCLLAAGLGGLILSVQGPWLSQLIFQTAKYDSLFRLLGITFIFSVQHQMPYNLFRLENKVGLYVGFSLFSFLTDFTLKSYFIIWLERGLSGYFESSAIVSILTLGLMLPFVSKSVHLSLDFSIFRQLFRLGSPYIFISLAVWTIEFSDRLLLNQFVSEEAVGIYSLAYSFANMFGILLASPVALLMPPFFFAQTAKRPETDTKKLLQRTLIYFLLAGGFMYLLITLSSNELLRFFVIYLGTKEKYLEAITLIPVLTLAPFLYFLTTQAELAGLTVKKPEIMSVAYIVAAIINFGLNLLVIPQLGAMGAAITTFIAYFILVIVFYSWIERLFPVGYNWKAVVLTMSYLAIAFSIGSLIRLDSPLVSLFIRAIVAVSVFTLLVLVTGNILTRMERILLFTYLLNGRKRLSAILDRF